MSDNAGSANSNSWTLLPQEVNIATLRPLAEGTEPHRDSSCDAERQTPEVATPAKREHHADTTLASEENTSGQCEGEARPDTAQTTCLTATPSVDSSPALTPTSETPPPPPSLGLPAHSLHGNDTHSQSEGLPECPVGSTPEPDSFSDSYTHISSSSSPDEPPVPELLGGLEMMVEEVEEEEDRLGSEGGGSVQRPSQSGPPVEPQVEDGEAKGEAELRRRSLLASLEEIGKREEEEEVEEEFQVPRVPQQNDDSGFTVNKCILGAVILLGLGTIFFSGVFMDLDEENDHASRDLRDTEQLVKQEWQKAEAPQASVDEGIDILNKLVTETQRILHLPAKTLAQEEELNAAKGQAAEGAQEQLRSKEEVEEEHANEDTLPHPMTATTAPPVGHEGESRPAASGTEGRDEKHDVGQSEGRGESTDLRDGVQTQRKAEGRKPKHDQLEGERSKEVKAGRKQKEERREGKEQGHRRGDQGEPWKERGGDGKGWRGDEERNDRKGEKKWKRGKHEEVDGDPNEERNGHETEKKKAKDQRERKESRGKEERKEWKRGKEERKDWKEEKEWKRGKEEGKDRTEERERKKGKSDKSDQNRKERGEWKQDEEEWKKGKDKESGKEWKEKKEWRGKGEDKEWRKDSDRTGKHDKEREVKEERKHREGKEDRNHWEGKEERKHREGKEERKHREGKEERNHWEGKEERKHREGKEERKHREGKEERNHREGKEERKHREGKEERNHWEGKEERKHREKEGKAKKEERKDANRKQDGKRYSDRGDDVAHQEREAHHRDHDHAPHQPHHHHSRGESLWQGDGEPAHTHRRPSFGHPDYWVRQRERLSQNALPSHHCHSVEDCALAEGTVPVQQADFEALLAGYLAKAEEGARGDTSTGTEVRKLAAEFFQDGVFVHDRMSFRDYLEDLADILEDMVDGNKGVEEEEEEEDDDDDSDLEDEMEMFGEEAMKRFAVEKTERKKETGRGRG